MSEPKLVSPLLDGFIMGPLMSDHHGVRCFPAMRENTDERYIVKIISIPASQMQLDALLLSGAYGGKEQALSYFKDLSDGIISETKILDRLSRLEGFLPYTGVQVVEMEDGVGYDVYLLSPYRRTLEKQMYAEPLTHLAAINLGLDMCAALNACRREGYLYLDLKAGNIYLTQNHGYCIGDLGFLSMNSLKYASMPEKYRSSYTAPEITDAMSELNDTLDIYALGLILYQIYNNGELPFEGSAPSESLPPPLYADYELSEIILKACAPDPKDRWQTPALMGQELVNYMQRNGVNDTSIIPPPIELPPEPEDEVEEFLSEDENDAQLGELLALLPEEEFPEEAEPEVDQAEDEQPQPTADEDTDLSFIADENEDETLPTEENAADLEDAEVTAEVAQMLAQADELIAHELPEPVVAPDPIDVPIPPPIQPEPEPEPEVADAQEEDVLPAEPSETPEEEIVDDPDETPEEPVSEVDPTPAEQEDTEPEEDPKDAEEPSVFEDEEADDEDEDIYATAPIKSHRRNIWLSLAISAVLIVAIAIGGWFFYHNYYLQTIDGLTIQAAADRITVIVDTDADESLLTVVCTDIYGNTHRSALTDGKAVFEKLNPNTQYKIQVTISGPHKLLGDTTASHSTPAQTEILNFTAICGPEDGSVILNFSVNGPQSENWIVEYGADGTAPITREFTGHSVTITGLDIGAQYTFRLASKDDIHLIGENELRFTAQKVIYAQNLTITACGGGSLTAVWTAPEGSEGITWSVRCYNDAGYDETVTTTENTVTFLQLDHSAPCTVQVIAVGMTQSSSTSVTANPITVTGFTTDTTVSRKLTLQWSFEGAAPSGWVLVCTINGGAPLTVECSTNSAELPLFPEAQYTFELRPADEVSFYCDDFLFDAPQAVPFTGYGVSASDMTFSMCLTPAKANWDRYDLKASDYTTTFTVGQKASFLVKLGLKYGTSDDAIVTTYVIRDENHRLVSENSTTQTWTKMWHKKYCELDIPALPEAAGTYVIDIYFNDMYVTSQSFTVQ